MSGFDQDDLRELELWPYIALTTPLATARPAASATPVAPVAGASPGPAARPRAAEAVPARAPANARAGARMSPPPPPTMRGAAGAPAAAESPVDPARAARIAALDWSGLGSEIAVCGACGLCKQRKQAVPGVGAESGPWLFIGEGPGADEDAQGEPFVGQAGKLLDAMLAAAGLARGREVYITNVVKCRPPGNRTPTPEEAATCAPFLDRQIDLIQPKLIVALGKTAITRLTGSDATMASFRGRRLDYRGFPVIATYHPSYLLRTPAEKLKTWEDLMLAKKVFAAL